MPHRLSLPSLPALLAVAVLLLLAASPPLQGQTAPRGSWSVGLPLFESGTGTVFNLGRMMTDRLHLGVEVDLRAAELEDDANQPSAGIDTLVENWDFALGPVIRWYGAPAGPVTPFLRARGLVGWGSQDVTLATERVREDDTSVLAASLGIGAEWFPLRQLSVSGYTGIQASRNDLERVDADGDRVDRRTVNVGTFRSALTLSFYFR